jgi:glycine dehydrogenase subunit 1
MHYGGGLAGFVASPDEERFVSEYPTFLIGVGPTAVEGEYAFGEVVWERTSYVQRGDSKEYTGTTQNLWAIAAGAYLALLGPEGLAELGRGILERARYAAGRLGELPGARAPALNAPFFKEFVVDFGETGRTVAEVNRALRERGIFGGLDLSEQYPTLGQSALFCVTEVHTQADIDLLVDELAEVLR